MNDLHEKLEEAIALCLEEMNENNIDMLPVLNKYLVLSKKPLTYLCP